jgi:3-mercaptopyruvate sulfurtransferase SseA
MKNGYRDVYALEGGWDEWLRAGFPVQSYPISPDELRNRKDRVIEAGKPS